MDLSALNPKQCEAVMHDQGPLLVLAGAGSGKTRVITYKVARLVFEKSVSPHHIMALTFTNKAAREMASRIEALIHVPVRGLMIGTFHSICARLLRIEKYLGGAFTIFDVEDQKKIIKEALSRLGLSDNRQFQPGELQSRISGLKNRMITAKGFSRLVTHSLDEQFCTIYRTYEQIKQANHGLDFDDLILDTIGLLEERTGVREKYQSRIRYLLVDEYQDTNLAQYALIRLYSGKHRNVTVVGDDDQSIYSWRGADLRNILEFEKNFRDTRVVRLEQNYRSTQIILDAANAVIGNNKGRKPKRLWTEKEKGEKIDITLVDSDREEAREIARLVRAGQLKDTAVFYRTNAQSRTLEDAFRDSGIPYVIVGGLRFYERREIKDVLAYLRVLVNPADTVSLFRIINTPRRGIGEKTITALAAFAEQRTLSPFEALVHIDKIGTVSQREMTSLLAFRSLMQELAQGPADADIVGYVKEVIKKTGYLEWLGTSAEEDASDRIDNVSELVNAVREYCERNESPTLQGFLEEVALLTDIDVVREEEMQVATLMTLHASKGLEFDHVFIAGLEDGLFPIARAEEADDIEEERRLFYVGLTRARKRAYLFHSVCRYRFGSVTSAMASPFLDELTEPCIRKIDKTNASPAPRSRHDARSRIDVQTDFLPDYENYSQTERGFAKGQRVYHPIWGEGTIIAISGISDNLKATIQFETSVKKVMVKYAKLEVVQS